MLKYGAQQQIDPYFTDCGNGNKPDCGNGNKPDGTPMTGNDPHDTKCQN